MVKKCGGTYTLDELLVEAKTLEEMAEISAEFPGIVRASFSADKDDALKSVGRMAKAAADAWCQTRDCAKGNCHQLNMPDYDIILEEETEIKNGPLKGIKNFSATAKVTKVTCGCVLPKPKPANNAPKKR